MSPVQFMLLETISTILMSYRIAFASSLPAVRSRAHHKAVQELKPLLDRLVREGLGEVWFDLKNRTYSVVFQAAGQHYKAAWTPVDGWLTVFPVSQRSLDKLESRAIWLSSKEFLTVFESGGQVVVPASVKSYLDAWRERGWKAA